MAQSSRKHNEETRGQTISHPILCTNNCGFFGSSDTMNLCSKCYKDLVLKQAKSAAVEKVSVTAKLGAAAESSNLPQASSTAGEKVSVTAKLGAAAESSNLPRASPTGHLLINRCASCKKRVGLTGMKCRCGSIYCSLHRYSDEHNCSYDYKSAGREAIALANPLIKAAKVEKNF